MTRNMLWLSIFALTISALTYYAIGPWWAKWVVDSLVLGVWAGMTWTWARAARIAGVKTRPDAADMVVVTLWMASAMYVIQRIYSMAVVALTSPEGVRPIWLTESIVPHMIATLIFIAGIHGLSAQSEEARNLPRRQYLTVVSGWFVAGIVTGAAAVYLLIVGF